MQNSIIDGISSVKQTTKCRNGTKETNILKREDSINRSLKKYHFEALIRKSSDAVLRTLLFRRGGGCYCKGKTTSRVQVKERRWPLQGATFFLYPALIFAPLHYSKWPPPPNFWITDTAFDELWRSVFKIQLWRISKKY